MESTTSEPRGIERETVAQGIDDFKSGGTDDGSREGTD